MKNIKIIFLFCLLSLCVSLAGCDSGSSDDEDICTVSFAANGGTGVMDVATVIKGKSYTVPACAFTSPSVPEGAIPKAFREWNSSPDGSGTSFSAGTSLAVNNDIVLYAQWTEPSFSVDENKKVYFSRGNLCYSAGTWSFEANQYDLHTWEAGKTGLFYWTKATSESYKEIYGEAGTASDILFSNTDESVMGAQWGSLSKLECMFMLFFRDGAENKLALATVAGGKGAIILPDVFSDPMKNNGSGPFVPASADNFYSAGDWSAMEAAGAVFMPSAGYRSGASVNELGDFGYYWLSDPDDPDSAFSLFFNSFGRGITGIDRNNGYSLRLVTEAR